MFTAQGSAVRRVTSQNDMPRVSEYTTQTFDFTNPHCRACGLHCVKCVGVCMRVLFVCVCVCLCVCVCVCVVRHRQVMGSLTLYSSIISSWACRAFRIALSLFSSFETGLSRASVGSSSPFSDSDGSPSAFFSSREESAKRPGLTER